MARANPVPWTREHRLIALNLYHKLPFGQFHIGNPIIKEIASKMGRTAGSLAIKLCNFASLDPVHIARGRVGMRGAANEDRTLWNEFHADMATFVPASEQMLHDLFTKDDSKEVDFLQGTKVQITPPSGSTEVSGTAKMRRGQQFFRQSVLNAYGVRCCISGINVPSLLVASHIKPWCKSSDKERLDPCNGLCLSALHDAAFDEGLITLDEQLRLVLSKRLRSFFPQPSLERNFVTFEGKSIQIADRVANPHPTFLSYHREVVFS